MYVSTSEENTGGQHYFIGDLPLQPTSLSLASHSQCTSAESSPASLEQLSSPCVTVLVTSTTLHVLLNGSTRGALFLLLRAFSPAAWTFYMSIAIFGSMLYIVLNSRVLKFAKEGVLRRLQGLLKKQKRFTKKYRRLLSANPSSGHLPAHEESSRLSNPVFSILLPHFMIVPPFMLTVFLATSTNFFPLLFLLFGDK
ncbi:hypothetical protein TYRP_023793, partial [Tyrophagus putrescentiae]